MAADRKSQTPFAIAFLRDHPNLGFSIAEIEKETGHKATGLSREAAKPGSQVIALPTRGMYMWTTTKQNVIAPEIPDDPAKLDFIGHTKDGDKIYRDNNGKLYRLIFEEI